MTAQWTTSARRGSGARYTAEIIEHSKQHPHGSVIDHKLLAITDLNQPGSRSVTNAIEEVLDELFDSYGMDLPCLIIYRDTTGVWDGVAHIEGTFRGFYPIRETDLARAIDKAVGHAASEMGRNTHDRCEPK
jgi:hypothetical protein